jgi:hypothetical protein
VACLTGTGHFSGSFTVPTYEQTDGRREDNGQEDKGERRRTAAKDEKDSGREGDLTAKESGEGRRRTTKQETRGSFH